MLVPALYQNGSGLYDLNTSLR